MERIIQNWRKSSYSSGNGGECVEAAHALGVVLVRDSKNRGTGPELRITLEDWQRLTATLKH